MLTLSSLQVLLQALQSSTILALCDTEHNAMLIDERVGNRECWQTSAVTVRAPRDCCIYVKQRFVFA